MSLYSACIAGFKRVGLMFRDHELRLQSLEKRAASLYPIVKFGPMTMGKTFPDQAVYRLDGTLAYKLIFKPYDIPISSYPPGMVSTNVNNTVAFIDVEIYGINGTTIIDNYTLKMDNDTNIPSIRGLINGSSFY